MKAEPRIGFVSLGCPKALVDSERILTQLRTEGYATAKAYAEADLVVVNTCGFIDSAVEESLEAIGEALAENGKVIVTGCLGARAELIQKAHPKVLAVTGPHALDEVMAQVHRHLPQPAKAKAEPFLSLVPPQGIKLTPRHYAYLKISEGCNHRCSFCIIPSLRGDLQSRPAAEVMREAHNLVRAGVKELLVIAQDTSAYGVDRRYRTEFWDGRPVKARLLELASALASLRAHAPEGELWIRLHYVYPYPQVDDLIPLMSEGRILPYLDVPLQHASPRILKLMKRPAGGEAHLERIQCWRRSCPDLVLRSTFIVGFPGETEAEFEELLAFLEAAELDRVGCFAYSPVAGARANDLPDPIPQEVREQRRARLMQVQQTISMRRLKRRVGKTLQVLIDEIGKDGAIGRSAADAPEIDGRVHVTGGGELKPGDWARVKIDRAGPYDLWGHVAGRPARRSA